MKRLFRYFFFQLYDDRINNLDSYIQFYFPLFDLHVKY